jgi:hemerythrin-like domain-containing protein
MNCQNALQTIRDEHASLAAMLQSMRLMVQKGPSDERRKFFDVLRAMLFYIDEFPERQHHPKESNLLFHKIVKLAPKVMGAVSKLEHDYMRSETASRELQHLLLAWELLGPSRRSAFEEAISDYTDAYLEHMNLEENVILPEAQRSFSDEDWRLMNAPFAENADPPTGQNRATEAYEKFFSLIVTRAPAPMGLG